MATSDSTGRPREAESDPLRAESAPYEGRGRHMAHGRVPRGVTDRVLLREAPDDSTGQIVHGWIGSWPPPANLVRVEKKGMPGETVLVNPLEQNVGALDQFRGHPAFIVTDYLLWSASKIDHPAKPGENWFRAAQYVRMPGPR